MFFSLKGSRLIQGEEKPSFNIKESWVYDWPATGLSAITVCF